MAASPIPTPRLRRRSHQEVEADELTEKELDVITTVFRSYETGLREATILPKDLHAAMKMLGLNPMEQEIIDLTNNIVRNGYIYFPEFCKVIHEKYRQDDDEIFSQNMFKMLCGTEPFPQNVRAKKYKIHQHFIDKKNFHHMMTNLPEKVSENDIEEMFRFADKDNDGRISYREFKAMINPPRLQTESKPSLKSGQTPTMAHLKRVTIMSSEDTESMSVTNFVDNVSLDRPSDHLLEY